jgi:hypothetical protein
LNTSLLIGIALPPSKKTLETVLRIKATLGDFLERRKNNLKIEDPSELQSCVLWI